MVAADVLAWDVDFYQDVRAGDHLKVLVKRYGFDDVAQAAIEAAWIGGAMAPPQ